MGFTTVGLKDKLLQMYPAIGRHGIVSSLIFDEDRKVYALTLKKDHHELQTFIEPKDATACMDGRECVHLGLKIAEFLKNFEG